ncbi:hypothetical protein Tco_0492935 [Tanacetum coccineum]
MTMHEVVHEMVVGECHEPNSEGPGFAWMAYMNATVAGLFLLVLLEYRNDKGVVRATRDGETMDGLKKYVTEDKEKNGEKLLRVYVAYDKNRSGNGNVRWRDAGEGDTKRFNNKNNMKWHRNEGGTIVADENEVNDELMGRSVIGEVKARCFLAKLPILCEGQGL